MSSATARKRVLSDDAAAASAASAPGDRTAGDADACAAPRADAAAATAPPFRGPASDSPLGELLLDVLGIACAVGHALDLSHCRFLCGATFRLGARRADGSLDRAGYKGGIADMIASSLRLQAGARLAAARAAPRAALREPRAQLLPTQLMRAAFFGRAEEVRFLLAAGAAVDARSALGWTALHCAAGQGHERIARLLLEGARGVGAERDPQNAEGATPLARAIVNGHLGVARLLLASGARQDSQDARGRTALHEAARLNDAGAVRALCGLPGFASAARLRCCSCRRVQSMLEGEESWDMMRSPRPPNAPPPSPPQCRCYGHTPLEVAVAASHPACADALRAAAAAAELEAEKEAAGAAAAAAAAAGGGK
jgi:hypothetical protein